jgi:hypothetical protein
MVSFIDGLLAKPRNLMRTAAVAAIAFLLTACATPPAQLKDDDFDWSETTVSLPPGKVFSGLQAYSRACGGILSQAPEWYPTPTGDGSKVDLFMRGIAGQTEFVYGLIELSETQDGATKVRTGVQTVYSKPAFRKRGWWIEKTEKMYSEIGSGSAPTCP